MRGDAGRHARGGVAAEAFEQFVGHLPGRQRAGVGEGLPDDGANAGLCDHRRDAIHVAEAIGDAGDAVQQEFRAGRPHRGDVVLDGEMLLAGHGIAGPELAWLVVGQSAEEGGWRRGVWTLIRPGVTSVSLASITWSPGRASVPAAPMAVIDGPSMRIDRRPAGSCRCRRP